MKGFIIGQMTLSLMFGFPATKGLPDRPFIVMSSKFNNYEGSLAVDSDPASCAVTGLEIGPWWKIDLGQPRVVTRVGIQGNAEAFQIRVGNETSDLGDRGNFANNPLCVFSNGVKSDNLTYFRCKRPRHGRFLSFHLVDPAWPITLRLCEVDIQYE